MRMSCTKARLANDRLINVTVNGRSVPDANLAWGFALDSLPGSNAERDRRQAAQLQARAETQALAARSESPPADYGEGVDVDFTAADAPPPLLNYEQAPCLEEGYLWTPGYWNWRGAGFYWVPGAWVQPPRVGLLWTPGYWAFMGGIYLFHAGYWGPHVGYYGGINYRYGYFGSGFVGGRWEGDSFAYNRAVNNLSAGVIHHTYSERAAGKAVRNMVSYNGGPGGTTTTPTVEERAAAAEPHVSATPRQRQIVLQSASNPELRAQTGPHPAAAAAKTAAVVSPPGPVRAAGAAAATAATSAATSAAPASHALARVAAQPNITLHPQGATERPGTRGTVAQTHEEGGSSPPAAPKVTRATPPKPKHPKP